MTHIIFGPPGTGKTHKLIQKAEEYIKDYPITYIIKNNKSAYIGETTNAKARIKSHLTNSDRKKLEKILLIGHKKFNQSATYNIETNLINYFLADQKKDIVSLFPDLNQPHLIHSCSLDRTISTYDLKQEKRMRGIQT